MQHKRYLILITIIPCDVIDYLGERYQSQFENFQMKVKGRDVLAIIKPGLNIQILVACPSTFLTTPDSSSGRSSLVFNDKLV